MQRDMTDAFIDSLQTRVYRLEQQRTFLLCLLVLLVPVGCGVWYFNRLQTSIHTLRVFWEPTGEVDFSSSSDGPFVVTHLVRYGRDEGEKAVATLPQPLAIVDSAGAQIPADRVAKYKWVGIRGQAIAPPHAGSDIQALYYRPEQATPRGK